MKYKFKCYGHENIKATHRNTFEITTDKNLSKNGNCIIGIKSNFEVDELKKFLKVSKLKMTLQVSSQKQEIIFKPNPTFFDTKELVIRLGNFESDRTFGTNADKSSLFIKRDLINLMKNPLEIMDITIENI